MPNKTYPSLPSNPSPDFFEMYEPIDLAKNEFELRLKDLIMGYGSKAARLHLIHDHFFSGAEADALVHKLSQEIQKG